MTGLTSRYNYDFFYGNETNYKILSKWRKHRCTPIKCLNEIEGLFKNLYAQQNKINKILFIFFLHFKELEIKKYEFYKIEENVFFVYALSKKYGAIGIYYSHFNLLKYTKHLLCQHNNFVIYLKKFKLCYNYLKLFSRINFFKLHCPPSANSLKECHFLTKNQNDYTNIICLIFCTKKTSRFFDLF